MSHQYSGKSSLVLSLLRMLPVRQGSIVIDDIDTSTIASEVVRAAFKVLPQNAVLFPGTVRLNIDLHSTKSDFEAISVLDKLRLWDAVVSCGGLEAKIEALALSQSRKKMFALARSLLNSEGRGILILDEFTSNMDTETEALMLSILDHDFGGCTVVTIAHMLETWVLFDHTGVLDRGTVVEWDTPAILLAIDGGSFKSLWDQQHR